MCDCVIIIFMKKMVFSSTIILILVSCLTETVPYLDLSMEELYTEGESIVIDYDFSSEQDTQPCRIQIWDLNDLEIPVWDNGDEAVYKTGTITRILGEGDYRLDFTVLSARQDCLEELSFLSESIVFRVNPVF